MSLAPRLDLRQSQSLVMTPQLQQAIKLLALSNLEIETFIAEEVEKNPLLDATATQEVVRPERTIPRAIVSALGIALLIYAAVAVTLLLRRHY